MGCGTDPGRAAPPGAPRGRVVRGTRLEQLVEPAEEAVLALALDEGDSEPDRRVVVLDLGCASLKPYRNTFDQVPELRENVLGQKIALT